VESQPPQRVATGAIALVARNGATRLCKLNADLVPPPRFQGQFHQAQPVAFPQHAVVRYGPQRAFGSGGSLPDPVRVDL